MHDILQFFLILFSITVAVALFAKITDSLFEIWRQRLRIKRIKLEIQLAMHDPKLFKEVMEELNDCKDNPQGS